MNKTVMIVDIDSCYGCKSCTLACKMNKKIPVGLPSCISVFRIETQNSEGNVTCDFIPVMCQHCENPDCIKECKLNAIVKNEEGLITIDNDLCVGCGRCVKVCSYGAISICETSAKKKKAYKCDLCFSRRKLGGKTICEQHCPGEVFSCLNENEAKKIIDSKKYKYSVGQVVYVSDILCSLGEMCN